MSNALISRIEESLWPEGFRRNVWMIVDGARDPRILPLLSELHLEHYCLYAGVLPPALKRVAPYLLQLDYSDEETRRFLEHAWGNSWGVFLKCGQHANAVRKHLRGFLIVHGPDGGRLVFRYYDPRVLRIYLPTCIEEELRTVFGPIECFWMEDGNSPKNMLEFRLNNGELVQSTVSLASDS